MYTVADSLSIFRLIKPCAPASMAAGCSNRLLRCALDMAGGTDCAEAQRAQLSADSMQYSAGKVVRLDTAVDMV